MRQHGAPAKPVLGGSDEHRASQPTRRNGDYDCTSVGGQVNPMDIGPDRQRLGSRIGNVGRVLVSASWANLGRRILIPRDMQKVPKK